MSRQPRSPIAAWFRSSRRMLAAELSQGGWLNFGVFRWRRPVGTRRRRPGRTAGPAAALSLETQAGLARRVSAKCPGVPRPPVSAGKPGSSAGPRQPGPSRPVGADAVNGSGSGPAAGANGTGAGAAAGAADRFADGVEDAARVIAGSLRSLRPPGDMPRLREWVSHPGGGTLAAEATWVVGSPWPERGAARGRPGGRRGR